MARKPTMAALALGAAFLLDMTAQAQSSAAATAPGRPAYGPLEAADLAKVQTVSRGVLAAKGQPQTLPQEQTILATLQNAANAVDQALRLAATPGISIQSGPRVGSGAAAPSAQAAAVSAQFTPLIASLRQHRAALEGEMATDRTGRASGVAPRLTEIEQALQDTVNAGSDADRNVRLLALRDSLRSRTPAQWWQDQSIAARQEGKPIPEETPTLVTITEHRPGLPRKAQPQR